MRGRDDALEYKPNQTLLRISLLLPPYFHKDPEATLSVIEISGFKKVRA